MSNKRVDTNFVTTSGKQFAVEGISETLLNLASASVEKEMRAEGVLLDPPTYDVEIVGGGKETHAHDDISIEEADDATKALYRQYKENLSELENRKRIKEMDVWMNAVVVPEEELNDPAWIEEIEYFGGEVPEHRIERKLFYIRTKVLKSAEDLMRLMNTVGKITYAGLVSEDKIDSAVDSFSGTLQGNSAEGESEAPAEGAVDAQPTSNRGRRGGKAGTAAEPTKNVG